MRIAAIILDGDGVLADLVEVHFQALNRALVTCGYPEISLEDQEKMYNGLPTKVKLHLMGLPADEIKRVDAEKQRVTGPMIRAHIRTDMRLVAMLQQLRDRGYRLAVCSNSVRASVDEMVYCTGTAALFEFTLSNQDVANAKPHPEIYTKACEKLGLKPWEVLVLEDNVNGQRAALEAGCRLCVVRDPNDVTLARILEAIVQHEDLGYLVPTSEARERRGNPRAA